MDPHADVTDEVRVAVRDFEVVHGPARRLRGDAFDVERRTVRGEHFLPAIELRCRQFAGEIDNFGELEAREAPGLTPRIMRARAGAGGAIFKFTLGAGTLTIKKAGASKNN